MVRALACLSLLAPVGGHAEPTAVAAFLRTDNGSVPPPDRREFRAEFMFDGSLILTACRGYKPKGCVERETRVPVAVIEALLAVATASELEARPARLTPTPPIGGGVTSGWVAGRVTGADLPPHPAQADAARVEEVLAALRAAIPKADRSAVNAAADRLATGE